ncbi:MAG: tetratricopeptide repeat protein [Gemmatimonadota bacterium]
MAKRRPTSSRQTPKGTADDAFAARVLEFWAWSRTRTELLVAMIVVILLLVGGTIYYANHRAAQREAAAAQLERLQQASSFQDPASVISDFRDFLTRYGGTPYAEEGRLVLAELLLGADRVGEAIEALEPIAPSFRNPLRLQATILLASALEEAEEWDRAAEVYESLSHDASFSHQRREATEGLARVRLTQGDSAAARMAYRRLLEDADLSAEARSYVEMRLAEIAGGS